MSDLELDIEILRLNYEIAVFLSKQGIKKDIHSDKRKLDDFLIVSGINNPCLSSKYRLKKIGMLLKN